MLVSAWGISASATFNGQALPNYRASPLKSALLNYNALFHHKCTLVLSLQRPGLLVLRCVDFVEAMQDPRHLFKVKQPESQMVEANLCALLTTCAALVEHGSCEAQHCFVKKCKNKKKLGHSSVSLDRGKWDKHNGEQFISTG